MDVIFLGHITDPILPIPPVRGGAPETLLFSIIEAFSDLDVGVISPWVRSLGPTPKGENRGIRYSHVIVGDRAPKEYRGRAVHLWRKAWGMARERRYLSKAAAIIREWSPKVIILNNRLHYATSLRARGVNQPIILYQHNVPSSGYLCRHCESITAVIAVSSFVLLSMRSYILDGNLEGHVVHNGVDPTFWTPSTASGTAHPDRREVLYVGRLNQSKGAHIILKAIPKVLQAKPEAQFVLVGASRHDLPDGQLGNSSYETGLRRFAERVGADNTAFAGNLSGEKVVEACQCASLGVVPSLCEEAFGMTVIEGMACGVPMICSRRGGIPEIITHEKDGILVDNYLDPDEWARQIIRLLDDEELRARLGRNARQTVLERFTIDRMVKDFRAYIERYL